MAEMLGYVGYEVVEASGGVEAISLARQAKPDLILLDVMMPDLDGRDACKALKLDKALGGVPVVLFSSADEVDVHWRSLGADGFVQKPFSIRALPDVVREYLASSTR